VRGVRSNKFLEVLKIIKNIEKTGIFLNKTDF